MHLRIIFRNIFSSWLGYVVTVVLGFVMSPFVVHYLGNAGYGVWTLVLSLTGYFGLLDLGIRSSVGRFVSRHIALNDHLSVNRTVSTALAILGAAGLIALSGTLVMQLTFGHFRVEQQIASSARLALMIAGVNVAVALPLSVFGAILVSVERFDVITGISITAAIVRAGLIFTLLRSGRGLIALAVVTLLVGLAEYSVMAIAAKQLYRPLRVRWRFVDRSTCKGLFGFGIYRFVWIVANQLIFYSDSIVIGIYLNAAAIAYYAIGASVINYGRYVVSLATDTMLPSATRLDSSNDIVGLQELLVLGTVISLLIGLPICFGFMLLGQQFIALWMGPGYGLSAAVLAVLTIPQFTSLSQYTSATILAGMARHKALGYIVLAEGIANLALSVVLVQRFGIIGVAWGTAIPHSITTAIVIPYYTLRTLHMSPWEYIKRAYLRPLLCGIPAALLSYTLSRLVETPTWSGFVAEVTAICSVFAVSAYFVCLTSRQQAALSEKVRGLFQREEVVHEA